MAEYFSVDLLHNKFKSALIEEDDVHLQYYLDSFVELNKFFKSVGSFFNYVEDELCSKVEILSQLLKKQKDENLNNFHSVKTMIMFEKNNSLLNKENYVSGSRTLLRLHRGLNFTKEFLRRIGELENDHSTVAPCQEVYERTLAEHHTHLIRLLAKGAMYTLPNRGKLLKSVCGEEYVEISLQMLPITLEVVDHVYNRVHKLYSLHDLHKLP